ncbi:MAG: hypothetical protein Q9159_003710 [Coniocarpon cinnabarinum]
MGVAGGDTREESGGATQKSVTPSVEPLEALPRGGGSAHAGDARSTSHGLIARIERSEWLICDGRAARLQTGALVWHSCARRPSSSPSLEGVAERDVKDLLVATIAKKKHG